MGSVKFKHGDLVILQMNFDMTDGYRVGNSIGMVIEPRGNRSYNAVSIFGNNEIWYFKDEEMDLLEPALTINQQQAKV